VRVIDEGAQGAFGSPLGGGTRSTIASKISSMPMPSFALARITSEGSISSAFSISSLTRSGSAAGRSILLMTGTIARF
jgi:hypothetical protein